MKKEVINNIVVCDYCKKDINVRNVYKNDGSFQKDYISLHGKDVCKHCALEVLDKISSKIKEDDVEEIFKVVKNNEFFSDFFIKMNKINDGLNKLHSIIKNEK